MRKINIVAMLLLIMFWSIEISTQYVQAATYRTRQDCTAYNSTGNCMANGEWPEIGCVAVHPTVRNGATPVIPFGTFLYIDYIRSNDGDWETSFNSPDGEITVLKVGDIGDQDFSLGRTTYFVDLYFGSYTTSANDWGEGVIYYHYN